jgi:hypothetical protein
MPWVRTRLRMLAKRCSLVDAVIMSARRRLNTFSAEARSSKARREWLRGTLPKRGPVRLNGMFFERHYDLDAAPMVFLFAMAVRCIGAGSVPERDA